MTMIKDHLSFRNMPHPPSQSEAGREAIFEAEKLTLRAIKIIQMIDNLDMNYGSGHKYEVNQKISGCRIQKK